MNEKQLAEAFDQCRKWANAPEPQTYWADVAAMVNVLSVDARRAGFGHLAATCQLCTPREGMNIIGRMLAALAEQPKTNSLTLIEAAGVLGISERVARDLIATGELTHHRVGNGRGQIRVLPRDIEAYQGRTETGFSHLFKPARK